MQSGGKAKHSNEDEDNDEAEDVEELRKSGFLAEGNEASPLTKGKPRLEAKAGDRRIKRTITFAGLDGSKQTRTVVYTDKEKVRKTFSMTRGILIGSLLWPPLTERRPIKHGCIRTGLFAKKESAVLIKAVGVW